MSEAQFPAATGAGWPGARAGATPSAPALGTDEFASGRVVVGCGGLNVSSPRIPSIWGATVAGTSGAARLWYPVFPDESR